LKAVTEHIRDHLLAGVFPADKPPMPSLEELRETEWVPEFEEKMRNRCIMGSFRYERMATKALPENKYNWIEDTLRRIKLYEDTGNTEHLVDAANLLMFEFKFGVHPNHHFSSVDDGEHGKKV